MNMSGQENNASYAVLKVNFLNKKSEIIFPIMKETLKSYQVMILDKIFWLSKSRFRPKFKADEMPCIGYVTNHADIQKFIAQLNNAISENSDAFVPVVYKGEGPTDKSAKYEFTADIKYSIDEYKQRTFTLPVSQITEENGKLFAPVWILREKLEAERKNMSRSEKFSNPSQWVNAGGRLEFGELRKNIEDKLVKLEQESNRDKEEIVRLNNIAKEFLVYVQGYLYINANLDFMTYKDRMALRGAKKQDLERNFILPGVSQSIEKISLMPEFQAWLTQFKLKELRVEVNRESIDRFTKYISNSKSKLALTSVEKIESANLSKILLGHHGGAHEYHIRRCDLILQLPEYETWKLKQAA